jgi:hypothetical protein
MIEIFPHWERAAAWLATIDHERPDRDALFDSFRATVDWPGVTYWRQLAAHYPHAKVILTQRDPERWYASARATIFNVEALPKSDPSVNIGRLVYAMFDNRVQEPEYCIDVFNRHNRDVVNTIAPERLLQYNVSEGWGPLCAFLGCKVFRTSRSPTSTRAKVSSRW